MIVLCKIVLGCWLLSPGVFRSTPLARDPRFEKANAVVSSGFRWQNG